MAQSNKDRKAAQTARENEILARLGGRRLRFLAYGATFEALELVCERQGFTGRQRMAEAITWLAHDFKNRDIVSTHEKEEFE